MSQHTMGSLRHAFGLGFDAGGTRTRWALADANGDIVAEGEAPGFSALQIDTGDGRAGIAAVLAELGQQVPLLRRPAHVHGGLTGFGGDSAAMCGMIADALHVPAACVTLSNDVEIAYHDVFAPGEGYLVYAGTGSIAAYIDADGSFHRAGGRGYLLDDGGGGRWIAREALRQIWRAEDEQPGSWRASPMARAIFERIGGADWAITRQFMHVGDRGALGKLALAVAETAETDPLAHAILREAGGELARLGMAMTRRYGERPFALSGRAVQLHMLIDTSFRAALPPDASVRIHVSNAHCAAARIAVKAGLVAAKNNGEPR
jgi:glucosamine kinase